MKTSHELKVETIDQGGFLVRKGRRARRMNFEALFELGHTLFANGHVHSAEKIFCELSKVPGKGVRAKIMWARCAAELAEYTRCERLVTTLFSGNEELVAQEMKSAMVYDSLGFPSDAISELLQLVKQNRDVPTASLYLGDLFFEQQLYERAIYCWKLAILRDQPGGVIARCAKNQLDKLQVATSRIKTEKDLTST
jgi:tetratricopeptide (TPR) repeat protein